MLDTETQKALGVLPTGINKKGIASRAKVQRNIESSFQGKL